MKKNLFLFLVLVNTCSAVLAQDSTSFSSGNVKVSQWEVGIDLLPLINKSQDPFGLILRRYMRLKQNQQAIRFKLSPSLTSSTGLNLPGTQVLNPRIYIALGYEWQRSNGRLIPYYGFEMFFRTSTFIYKNLNVVQGKTFDNYIGISGFFGAKYRITNQLGISLESHLLYDYHRGKATSISGSITEAGANVSELYFRPIYAIYLNYYF